MAKQVKKSKAKTKAAPKAKTAPKKVAAKKAAATKAKVLALRRKPQKAKKQEQRKQASHQPNISKNNVIWKLWQQKQQALQKNQEAHANPHLDPKAASFNRQQNFSRFAGPRRKAS